MKHLLAIAAALLPLSAHAAPPPVSLDPVTGTRSFQLWDGSRVSVAADGVAVRTRPDGRKETRLLPQGASDLTLLRTLSLPQRDGLKNAAGDFWVSPLSLEPRPLPAAHAVRAAPLSAATVAGLPTNYGLQTSFQAHLNSTGVDAVGAFVQLARRFGQLPGEGIRITNVSVGDLTDQAMADAGDAYVQTFGPTSRVESGQRYLDYPSLPLIPTFTVDGAGKVDPLGTVEFVDPYLSEVLLDFSVMAPLPHDRQRPEAQGNRLTDLLGIAPGAQYRLVVPVEPTVTNIYVALLAAANQSPRPDVITASLGFGADAVGFPGRYLEDDPAGQAVVASIVAKGIVVCISSNDGTRLYTPAAVNLEGGSAATNVLAAGEAPTSFADDATSTIATRVADSFAIAVGGTTLDDIFSAPPSAGGPLAQVGQFPQTRYNGAQGFSSGYGSRVNLAAPSDGIVALIHLCSSDPCSPQDAIPVLGGGTSASAPMVAAAAAVVLQTARLTHRDLSPREVRELLVRTGRPLAQPPQAGLPLTMGTQLDVSAAVQALLGGGSGSDDEDAVSIVRLGVAHRREMGALGAAFREDTDPSFIDLAGGADYGLDGQWVTGPITFAPDLLGVAGAFESGADLGARRGRGEREGGDLRFALVAGAGELVQSTPAFRLLPAQLLALANLPVASAGPRSLQLRYEVRRHGRVLASLQTRLVLGPTDGTFSEAPAPAAPAVVDVGDDVLVSYDLSGVRTVSSPALFVSGINHFSPTAAPLFHPETLIPLSATSGRVRIPASAFRGGAGLYGIGLYSDLDNRVLGQIATVRVAGRASFRPEAPLVSGSSGAFGHSLASPGGQLRLRWDAGAGDGAVLEISAPGPTLRNALNTFSNASGDRRDDDGSDSPSTHFVPLPSRAGTHSFDLEKLGLAAPLFYNLRIFATRHGQIASEASPSSSLELTVPEPAAGAQLVSFDVAGSASTVTLATVDTSGNLLESTLQRFSPAQGDLGAVLASDASGGFFHQVVGTDPVLGRTLVVRLAWGEPAQIVETYDAQTGVLATSQRVEWSELYVLSARIDPWHHRAALLGWDANFNAVLRPLDLSTGQLLAPVALPPGLYNSIQFDPASSKVYAGSTMSDESCVVRKEPVAQIDLDTQEIVTFPVADCVTGFLPDGESLHLVDGPLIANRTLLPVAKLQAVDEATLLASPAVNLAGRSPLFPALDPLHHLLFVGFIASEDFEVNSNATSAVAGYDLRTGARVFYSTAFNFARAAFANLQSPLELRGIQLDPQSRTGFAFGPSGREVQRFKY